MRKTKLFILSITLIIVLCGCNRLLGGALLEMAGFEFTSQIEAIEEYLSIELDDLTDDSIETIYTETDPEGNSVCIQFVSLDGAGDIVASQIKESDRWSSLPLNEAIDKVLVSNDVYNQYDFENINGYFTISGILPNGDELDFNQDNINKWQTYEIGIWDSYDETLYYISITRH